MTPFRFKSIFQRPGAAVALGFTAMLVLMVFLASTGIIQLKAGQQRLENLVENPVAKMTYANRMYMAARERTVSLQRLLLQSDPFERDEQWMRFLGYASEFAQAREALTALTLSDREREILEQQSVLTRIAVPIQNDVVDLMWKGRSIEAHKLLVNEAIPAQDKVLSQLRQLYRYQEEQVADAAHIATVDYRNVRMWLQGLALLTLGLAVGIALAILHQARRADAALREEKERAQVTLYSLGEAVLRTGADGRVEYLNPVAERMTGWTTAEAQGQTLESVMRIVHDVSRQPVANPAQAALTAGQVISDAEDTLLIARHGDERAIDLTATALPDGAGAVLVFRDVTEVRALSREIAHQATHDLMTGLVNRREFERRLQRALDESQVGSSQHALCYLDLDLFKAVNDTCGHLAGDELLKQLAGVLRTRVRKEDVLARIGGDEFAILLQGCHLEKAVDIGETIRQSLKDYRFAWEDKRLDVGASIGVVPVNANSGDLNDVLRSADMACRIAKEEGRNRLHVLKPNDLVIAKRQREINWVQSLRRAIDDGNFVLYGQWIQPLTSERGLTPLCEILLQMQDGNELVSPTAFLPAAERYHLMPTIDRWVVQAVFRELAEICPSHQVCFNINLSGQTLCDPDFLAFIERELDASGLPPSCIGFEITESAAVTHMSRAVQLISALRARGCRFSLDDFGSGVSSFTYLKHMPVDYLKIDGSFVHNSPDDRADLAMVTSINQVAHILGIKTVAEYVENKAIRDAMARVGVDYGQGYAMAMPQPLAHIVATVGPRVAGLPTGG
jgi:diguanylate cyclase (GGDEF)-like protein/PAS domain S-box-containing protein